eukprot:scaffold655_cov105-Isochrysis_galbana.AAC.1
MGGVCLHLLQRHHIARSRIPRLVHHPVRALVDLVQLLEQVHVPTRTKPRQPGRTARRTPHTRLHMPTPGSTRSRSTSGGGNSRLRHNKRAAAGGSVSPPGTAPPRATRACRRRTAAGRALSEKPSLAPAKLPAATKAGEAPPPPPASSAPALAWALPPTGEGASAELVGRLGWASAAGLPESSSSDSAAPAAEAPA